MSDNLRRYRAIRDALIQGSPGQPTGTVARHVTTLAARMSGIVGSTSPPLPSVAPNIPEDPKPASRVKRLARGLDTARLLAEGSFVPSVNIFLTPLALETRVGVREGSVVGRGCLALRRHVVEKGRALPLAWRVRPSPKGPWPEALPIAVVALMSPVLPEGAKVVLLGDGECDGTALQDPLSTVGWADVCRPAMSTTAPWDSPPLRLDPGGACLQPGRRLELPKGSVTREMYGPSMGLCCWAKG